MAGKLSGVQWTFLLPLLSRARITLAYSHFLNDPMAVEIVKVLSGPLAATRNVKILCNDLGNAARARVLDDAVKAFIRTHPKTTIVNLGSGMDTTFYRVDNGELTWYDIDLPDIIKMRKLIIPETDRTHYIACSVLDDAWTREINSGKNGLLMIAGGLFHYFSEDEVKRFMASIAGHFPEGEIVFDVLSRLGRFHSLRRIKKAGISDAPMKWTVGRRHSLDKWDPRVIVLEHYPLFARIERSPDFHKEIIRLMDQCDKGWRMSVFHLKIG